MECSLSPMRPVCYIIQQLSIFLLLKARVHSVENAEIAGKSAGTGPKNARSAKGICTEVTLVKAKGAILVMVTLPRCVIFVEERAQGIQALQEESQESSRMVESKTCKGRISIAKC